MAAGFKDSTEILDEVESFSPLNSEGVRPNGNRAQQPNGNTHATAEEIPEPNFTFTDKEDPKNSGGFTPPPMGDSKPGAGSSSGGSYRPNEPKQPIDDEDQEMSAEFTAEMALMGIGWLKQATFHLVKIKEKKLVKLEKSGDINLSLRIPLAPNNPQTVSLLEYVKQFNENNKPLFDLTEGYRKKARPILVKEFEKRGITMSPMGILVAATLKEFAEAGVQVFMMGNQMIDSLKEYSASNKGESFNVQQTQPSPIVPQPGDQSQQPPFTYGSDKREPEETQVSVNPNAPTVILKQEDKPIPNYSTSDKKKDKTSNGASGNKGRRPRTVINIVES